MKKQMRRSAFYELAKPGGVEAYRALCEKQREARPTEPEHRDSGQEIATEGTVDQIELTLRLLHEAREEGEAVGRRDFMRAGVRNINARIGLLRKKGFGIENTWWSTGRSRDYPAYRLLFDPERDEIRASPRKKARDENE